MLISNTAHTHCPAPSSSAQTHTLHPVSCLTCCHTHTPTPTLPSLRAAEQQGDEVSVQLGMLGQARNKRLAMFGPHALLREAVDRSRCVHSSPRRRSALLAVAPRRQRCHMMCHLPPVLPPAAPHALSRLYSPAATAAPSNHTHSLTNPSLPVVSPPMPPPPPCPCTQHTYNNTHLPACVACGILMMQQEPVQPGEAADWPPGCTPHPV
jgi:hypothetical protein